MRVWRTLAGLVCLAACGGRVAPQAAPTAYLVYVRDREGSVVAAVDDRGKTLSTTADDAFGLRLSSTGTPVPREFLDQDRDNETGYLHFQRRTYDPATAQWISPDPKLLEDPDCSDRVQGCNPYAFAGNRPLEWTDPDGREVTAFVDEYGRQGLLITAGFYGPQAQRAQQMFHEAMFKIDGELRVIALTAVYKSAAEIPAGITRIEGNLDHVQSGGPYRGSDTSQNTSVTHLGADALMASDPHWPFVIQHEVLHLAGLPDRYRVDQARDGSPVQVNDPPSQKGSVMALIYDTPNPHLTGLDLTQIASSAASANQGMSFSSGTFGAGRSLQSFDTCSP